jgi:hypothetical protein
MSHRRDLLLLSVLAVAGCAASAAPTRPMDAQTGSRPAASSSQVVMQPEPPASDTGFRHQGVPAFDGYLGGGS